MRRGKIPTVPELASKCFPIDRKGCGYIAEHAEELPNRWRYNGHVADLRVGVYKRFRTTILLSVASGTSWML